MIKIYSLFLFFSFFLIGGLQAQVPVMNPIIGASVVCSPPSSAPVYSTSASNSPTSYQWVVVPSAGVVISTPNSSTTSISFPTPNGTYNVYCYATNGSGSGTPTTFVVTVFETPNVTFSGATSFCQGSSTNIMASSTMMSASSTISYFWSPPTGLNTSVGQFVSASPTTVTNYTVTAFNGSCSGTNTITITPIASPTVNASFTNPVICVGDLTTLNASGGLSYTVSPFAPLGSPYTPFSTTQYTVTGSNSAGCTNNAIATVFVNPGPFISVVSNPPMSCMGQSVVISWGGTGTTYSFNTVPVSVNSVVVSTTVNTTYTISATTSQGCTGSTYYTLYTGCVGIYTPIISGTAGLKAYPNPSSGQFNLRSEKDEVVKIYNEFGQLVRDFELKGDVETKVNDLSAGVYFVISEKIRIKIIVLE